MGMVDQSGRSIGNRKVLVMSKKMSAVKVKETAVDIHKLDKQLARADAERDAAVLPEILRIAWVAFHKPGVNVSASFRNADKTDGALTVALKEQASADKRSLHWS